MNASVFPRELRERSQWVLWRREIRDGKATKIPFRASSPTLEASSTNPETWASFEDAVAAAGQADGVGFVFASDDPFTGVDLDDCLAGEVLHPEAAAVVAALGSFTERSPSGAGVHVLVQARKNTGRCRLETAPWGGRLEVYDHARFFCVTGKHLRGTPAAIEPRQEALEEILDRLLPEPSTNGAASAPRRPVDLADSELLERMFAAKNGGDVEALWRGDTSRHGGDDSAADLALCSHLAFWTGNDAARIDSLFRSSGLMREKWERADYRVRSIERAIAGTTEVFAGPIGKARPVTEADLVTANGKDDGSGSGELEPRETEDLHVYKPLELETFLASPPPEPDWDWRGFHARGDVVLEAGDPGVGKSMTVLGRAVKAAMGGGEHLAEPVVARRVLFVDLESPEDVVYARLWAFGLRGEVDGFAYLHRPPGFNLLEPASLARFRETLIRNRVELCFVDSLRRAAPALDENDSRAVRRPDPRLSRPSTAMDSCGHGSRRQSRRWNGQRHRAIPPRPTSCRGSRRIYDCGCKRRFATRTRWR